MPDRKKNFRLAHSSVRAWWENWAKERMGGGGKEKEKKTYQKMIGEVKNIHSEGIQSFEILKTCEKRKKVRRGEGVI